MASRRASTRTLPTVRETNRMVPSPVRRTVLPSGLRILTEDLAGARSVSIGVWIGVGSRDESAALHGGSHFLEHLLFKGTRRRSALDISIAFDAVGGEVNAFTAKEYTCFHARVLDQDLPMAVDVLGDMMTSSRVTTADVEAERDVILDEIAMHDDDPDDVVHNLFAARMWGSDSPLGRPIAGSVASIQALSRAQVARFYRRHYRPETMVVAVAGRVDHADVVAMVRRGFAGDDFLAGTASPAAARSTDRLQPVAGGTATAVRQFEQVNLALGTQGLRRGDPRRYALGVLNTALGGGTSSRLFQEVRERRGLAYSVYSFSSAYADSGALGVSAGCLPGRLDDVLEVVRGELAKVRDHGISEEELGRGKGQLRGGLVLALEDSGSRMSRLGKAELTGEDLLTVDQILERIDAVTLDQVREVGAEVLGGPETLAVVGPRSG